MRCAWGSTVGAACRLLRDILTHCVRASRLSTFPMGALSFLFPQSSLLLNWCSVPPLDPRLMLFSPALLRPLAGSAICLVPVHWIVAWTWTLFTSWLGQVRIRFWSGWRWCCLKRWWLCVGNRSASGSPAGRWWRFWYWANWCRWVCIWPGFLLSLGFFLGFGN